jgi:beta-ribofuranosylaminobenzene 5'-phosphate synthase
MIRIRTACRLHFGLLSLAGEGVLWSPRTGEPGETTLPARRFGGAGLMVELGSHPGLELLATPASTWSADGSLADRALLFARQVVERLRAEIPDNVVPPQHLHLTHAPPQHAGLGTGTQLGLAVAQALTTAAGLTADLVTLARWSGRGLRSALGAYGFQYGGFLVEAGQRASSAEGVLSPLLARVLFPPDWRVLLVLPDHPPGLHGLHEQEAFAHLAARETLLAQTDRLCRLVLLGLLPALHEADLAAFSAALYEFNYRAGELFAPVQSGPYASALVAELVAFVRRRGVVGVGQSSWGPTVFAVVADQQQGEDLADRLRRHFAPLALRTWVTRGCNEGAAIQSGG